MLSGLCERCSIVYFAKWLCLPNASVYSLLMQNSQGTPRGKWQHDMYNGGNVKLNRQAATGSAKLLISNLDYGVSDADIGVSYSC